MQIKTVQDIKEGDIIDRIHNNPGCTATVVYVYKPINMHTYRKNITIYCYEVGRCSDLNNKKDYIMYSLSPKAKVEYIDEVTINQMESEFILD